MSERHHSQHVSLREGPEAVLQRAVEQRMPFLFPQRNRLVWTAGSLMLGAGRPDIVLTACRPRIRALADGNLRDHELLAYLRAVGRAKPATIATRLGRGVKSVTSLLSRLTENKILTVSNGSYSLAEGWREVLPEIVTVEVKVDNWQRGLAQAARNRIFAHRSFIALPVSVAERVRTQVLFGDLGIGILAVEESGAVRVLKRARRSTPKVWAYYYTLASMAAVHFGRTKSGFQRSNRKRKITIS